MTSPPAVPAPEFSRPLDVGGLPSGGRTAKLTATAQERTEVARRLKLLAIDSLTAMFEIMPSGKELVLVNGAVDADVVQECVVTLAPLNARVHEAIARTFTLGAKVPDDEDIAPDDESPDQVIGREIDLGEVAVEHLALALEPYPRAPGAVFEGAGGPIEAENQAESPFAVLAKLKSPGKNK